MSFFKRLFSSGKSEKPATEEMPRSNTGFQGIFSREGYENRFEEMNLYQDPSMLEGCYKMLEGYRMANQLHAEVTDPINHPGNLDQVVDEGFGFLLYCKSFHLGDSEATMFLAYAFSDYLIKKYGFRLYRDAQPEFPLRSMSLKFDQDRVVVSVYPFEYACKVMNNEATFTSLSERIDAQIGQLPSVQELVNAYLKP